MADLSESPIGLTVPIVGTDQRFGAYRALAYQPAALPANVPLAASTWNALLEATTELARLDQSTRQIPNPALLRRPTLRREAQSTSALEGTVVAFTEVLEAEAQMDQPRSHEIREVLNYIVMAENAFEWIEVRPITLGLLEGLQGQLVDGMSVPDPGRLRERQVVIGSKGRPISEARFVPQPPGPELRRAVEELLEWINEPIDLPPIARAALAHYQFETIHPFTDGNGRLGRLLVVLQLMRDGALRDPVLIVSPWFEERRAEYQRMLFNTSATGDFDAWITFFSHGISAQAFNTRERIDQLLDVQQRYRETAAGRGRGLIVDIADGLIEHPIMSINNLVERYGASFQSVNAAVSKLVEAGLLDEISGRARDRLFRATDVMAILDV